LDGSSSIFPNMAPVMPEFFEKLFSSSSASMAHDDDLHQGASPCMQSIKNFVLKPHDISPMDSCSSELYAHFGGSVYSDSKYQLTCHHGHEGGDT
jgi:hypothetical protein